MIRSWSASFCWMYASARLGSPISAVILRTASAAPPCSGPFSAPVGLTRAGGGGGDGRELGGEPLCLAQVGLARVIVDIRVEGGEGGNGRAQDVDGAGVLDQADDLHDLARKGGLAGEPGPQGVQLRSV